MNQNAIAQYLETLKDKLINSDNWQRITLSRAWARLAPDAAGVYVIKQEDNLIYVGETGNLRGRMLDLLYSRQHSFRRSLGTLLYSNQEGYVKTTSSRKFPATFEVLLSEHINTHLSIAYMEVPLGRKELEELIDHSMIKPEYRLNKRGKRKALKIKKP